jgi:hypothetical protein
MLIEAGRILLKKLSTCIHLTYCLKNILPRVGKCSFYNKKAKNNELDG